MSPLKKIYFVYKHDYKVITDYISSINIFDKCIGLIDVNTYYNTQDIFIFGQMWLQDELIKQLSGNPNAMFLNVEMLTEIDRLEYIQKLIKHNITIIDYSVVNITIINSKIKELDIQFTKNILHLPYQYNSTENKFLQCDTNCFEYDVGVINAIPGEVEHGKTSRRTELWNKLLQTDWKVVNIMGWGEERDNIIKKCKIILNIHHFDFFTIFEEIRCCRLLFANKIIISEKSLLHEQLDIRDNVIWCDYDDILLQTKVVLDDWDTYNYNKDMGQIAAKRKEILEHSYKLITGRNMPSEIKVETETDIPQEHGTKQKVLKIPIVIISWNCLSFIRNFISQIKNLPNPIIILDNNSSYDNLHKYYDHLECELKGKITIKRLTENYGHTVYITRRDLLPEVYILTDPDLQLNIHMPSNVAEILYNISRQYKMFKVGLSLDISNSDKFCHNKNYALDPDGSGWKNIKEWETRFWINRIPHDKYELYDALIDTTFTLVNWNYFTGPNKYKVYRGIRIAGDFTCMHLPWYNNFLENNLLNAELTYLKTDNKSSTIMKIVTLQDPVPDTNKDIIAAARQMAINLWGSL